MTASGDTTIGETDAALRSESALLDERLPVRWDGEIIHWTDRWTDIGRHAVPLREQPSENPPGMPRHRQSTSMEPAPAPLMEAMEHHRPHDPKPVMPDALRRVRTDPRGRAPV